MNTEPKPRSEIEKLWQMHIEDEAYQHRPNSEEVTTQIQVIRKAIIDAIGEGGEEVYHSSVEWEIYALPTICEKAGFIDGFKMAVSILAEACSKQFQ